MEQGLLFDDFEEIKEKVICGADEAGRGPLAGPVFAAAVILPQDFPIEILNDSKVLSEKKRNYAEKVIREKAIFAVSFSTQQEIDKINILNASLLAMKRAYLKVEKIKKPDIFYVDGNKKPIVHTYTLAIIKGDSKIPEIMAASILAKNARDRFMIFASKKWPKYDFEHNKGYPTNKHKQALYKYGPCPIHRKTFKY